MVNEDIELKYLSKIGVSDDKLLDAVTDEAKRHCFNLRERGELFFQQAAQGSRPVITIPGETLSHCWEKACISVLALGSTVPTYYDHLDKQGKSIHVGSREAKVIMQIQHPFDPRVHKDFPGGIDNLVDYAGEVIDGNGDHEMMPFEDLVVALRTRDPETLEALKKKWEGKWKYTYHERLTAYPTVLPTGEVVRVNQFEQMQEKLKREPLSKSVQAATWVPLLDHNEGIRYRDNQGVERLFKFNDYDSPCFQRFWYRLTPCNGQRGGGYRADVDTDWRSRD
ncbi:MAG: hypothetical protein KKB21_04215, partial [Nanoarchaeota archaeon]|nr:hypothetical protein [Nanoarchaeota archaeon]